LANGGERHSAGGRQMALEETAESGAITGPRKCHQTNNFRVSRGLLAGRGAQHWQSQFSHTHDN
jgi:predicted ATPase